MPDILTTADIIQRYGCERHTAARIINSLPRFRVGKRLFVKMADLLNWEESRIEYPMPETMTRHTMQITRITRRKPNEV